MPNYTYIRGWIEASPPALSKVKSLIQTKAEGFDKEPLPNLFRDDAWRWPIANSLSETIAFLGTFVHTFQLDWLRRFMTQLAKETWDNDGDEHEKYYAIAVFYLSVDDGSELKWVIGDGYFVEINGSELSGFPRR
jgi:hypothetical protein